MFVSLLNVDSESDIELMEIVFLLGIDVDKVMFVFFVFFFEEL